MPSPEHQIHAYARLLDDAVPAVSAARVLVTDSVPAGERRRSRTRVVVFASIVIVALAIAGAVIAVARRDRVAEPGVPASTRVTVPLVRPTRVDGVHVPSGSVDVAVGEGALWVSGFNAVSRLDPSTDRVVASIPTPGVEDFSKIALGEGSVWVTADGGNVYRIDPSANRVAATIHVGGSASGIAVGAGRVWIAPLADVADGLLSIDPRTNTVTDRTIPVRAGAVAYGAGALWVTEADGLPQSLVRVNPTTEHVSRVRIPGPVTVAYGSLWNVGAGVVRRYDLRTHRLLAAVPVPRAQSLAFSAGAVWVLAAPRSSNPTFSYPIAGTAALWELDPRTNRIVGKASRLDALQPIAITANHDHVWIADYLSGRITRFRLGS